MNSKFKYIDKKIEKLDTKIDCNQKELTADIKKLLEKH